MQYTLSSFFFLAPDGDDPEVCPFCSVLHGKKYSGQDVINAGGIGNGTVQGLKEDRAYNYSDALGMPILQNISHYSSSWLYARFHNS